MVLHGLDLHKRQIQIASVHALDGETRQQRVPATREALAAFFGRFSGPQRAVAESTGSWYWVADLCREMGVELHLAHAHRVRAITTAKVKTDPADANALLALLRLDLVPEAHVVSNELREVRDLMRARLRLIQRRVSAQNSIARLLEKYNVSSSAALPRLARQQVLYHQEQIALLSRQTKDLVKTLRAELRPNEDVRRLMAIPGIGILGAFTLCLEIDGIERFASEKQFFSYCRLVPGAQNSAERRGNRRSRAGNRYLKLAFSHAARRAIQHYPEIRAYAQQKGRKKNRFVVRALVAKELARIVFHLLTKQEEFGGTFKGVPLSRSKRTTWPRRASPKPLLNPPADSSR